MGRHAGDRACLIIFAEMVPKDYGRLNAIPFY